MLEVIAYPPPRRWWQVWIPRRPHLLRAGVEYTIDPSGEEATIFRPRRGWEYKVAFVRA
jgi:hypothetical protein